MTRKLTGEDPLFLELSTPQQADRMRERAEMGPAPRTHEGQAPDVDALELNTLIYDRIVSNHARLYEEGVMIAMGTEGGAFSPHLTLQLLVEDVGTDARAGDSDRNAKLGAGIGPERPRDRGVGPRPPPSWC